MSPKEQEVAIGELEDRVNRLRTLYEQYFLGFEKLEPSVPKKDVERRFALLRKEQIRNTAMRFRFNVVTQKYNTYGMYWTRICRQIEEGTYKRHLQRARKMFGGGDARELRDLAIDVDLADFEASDVDVDALLAEADAAVARYERADAPDTVPPPPASARPVSERESQREPPRESQRESQPGVPSASIVRAARPAALPAGSKPRIVRKVARGPVNTEPPPSDRTNPGAEVASSPTPSAGRIIAPTSSPEIRARAPAAIGRIPVANPPIPGMRGPAASSPSVGRIPVAPTSSPTIGRAPVANPPLPGGMRAPAPSSPSVGTPSSGRIVPPAPTSAGRMPVAVPPPPASGRLPAAAGSGMATGGPGTGTRPVVRAPAAPPPPEADDTPPPRPSMRPPPPLPSQLARPKKKD